MLKTKKGIAFMQKMDIFKRKIWYSYTSDPSNFIELALDRVQEIILDNNNGNNPETLEMYVEKYPKSPKHDYENVVGQDSITRFDKIKSSNNSRRKKSKKKQVRSEK